MSSSEWSAWINRKYVEWRGDSRATVSEFAAFLGVSQATVSAWINGTRGVPTSQKIIAAVGKKFPEVYDIVSNLFGIPNLSPSEKEALALLNKLPSEKRKAFLKTLRDQIDGK
jgi:predicted transcriptional regulator